MRHKLTSEDMVTFFTVFTCCGLNQMVDKKSLTEEAPDEINCVECGEPQMFRSVNGLWYTVHGRLFE